jgi:hypothetical protein
MHNPQAQPWALYGGNMAKNKKPSNDTQDANPAPIQRIGENPLFKRIGAVTLPTLKTVDGKPEFIMVTGAIEEKMTQGKDEDGKPVLKKISVMPIVNLQTGELMGMVPGKALVQNLKDYKGGNGAYIGLCFEVTKFAKAEGKTWKAWSIHEIAKPEGV